jgi:endoglucanase
VQTCAKLGVAPAALALRRSRVAAEPAAALQLGRSGVMQRANATPRRPFAVPFNRSPATHKEPPLPGRRVFFGALATTICNWPSHIVRLFRLDHASGSARSSSSCSGIASPDATIITLTSGGSLTDNRGNIYTLDPRGNAYENGALIGSYIQQLAWKNGGIWQLQTNGNWYWWFPPSTWVQGPNPFLISSSSSSGASSSGGPPPWGGRQLVGVNLSGLESGPGGACPTPILQYYQRKHATLYRIPFSWEAMLNGNINQSFIDAGHASSLDGEIKLLTANGAAYVLLDCHNYMHFPVNGAALSTAGGPSPNANDLANLWIILANRYKNNPYVVFDLMNEPWSQSAADCVSIYNTVIAAIRAIGATNWIAMCGTSWSGAQSWVGTNDAAFVRANIHDPLNKWVIEPHYYWGSHTGAQDDFQNYKCTGNEYQDLIGITNWARAQNPKVKLIMGENGWMYDQASLNSMQTFGNYMVSNKDVWMGWAVWDGGSHWGTQSWYGSVSDLYRNTSPGGPYPMNLAPDQMTSDVTINPSGDAPQMTVLQNFMRPLS